MFNFDFTDCKMEATFENCDSLYRIDMNMKLTIYNASMLDLLLNGTLKMAKVNSIDFELYTIVTSVYSAEALAKIKSIKEKKNHNPLLDKEAYWNKIRELIIKKDSLINNMKEFKILNISFIYEQNLVGGN